jgi:hypothetical protein
MGGPVSQVGGPMPSQAQTNRMVGLQSQAQTNITSFSPQKGFIADRNTPQFHQLFRWLVSDDPTGEEPGCGGPGLAWLHVVCGCEAG